jgi:phenylalanine-4-hydroxylase
MDTTTIFESTAPRTFNGRTRYAEEDHDTWETLHKRQTALVWPHVCNWYKEGAKLLELPKHAVPQLLDISPRIEHTGWKLVPAEERYLSDQLWFGHFQKKEFPVTNYIRKPQDIDFTPEPDMFHDYFGHVPFMVFPFYTEFAELFGEAFRVTPPVDHQKLANVWWHTFEFGLIRENGEVKFLGAGLISSKEECLQALDTTRHLPFSFAAVYGRPRADKNIHSEYFVIESLSDVREALETYIKHRTSEQQ